MYSAMLFAALCVPDGHYHHRNNVLVIQERVVVQRTFVPTRSLVTVLAVDPFFVSRRTVFVTGTGGGNVLTVASNGQVREFVSIRPAWGGCHR